MTRSYWSLNSCACRLMAIVCITLLTSHLAAEVASARPRRARIHDPTVIDDALVRARALGATSTQRSAPDTVFFGGLDETTGLARVGGVWDFELDPGNADPAEGWTAVDLTILPTYVRRVTASDFTGDPASGLMTDGGSTASLWWGAHEAEAAPGCWPGGMGYSNNWVLQASKTFTYSGSGSVQIALDYFTDSETQFDYSYVYVINDLGVRSPALNMSMGGRPEDGFGYSGSVQEGTNLGTPSAPLREVISAEVDDLPGGPADFEVLLEFDSDPLHSDGMDTYAGFLNSIYGPLGIDDIHVTGDGLDDMSDFELGSDGWNLAPKPPIGSFFAIEHLSTLEPLFSGPCGCPVTDHVMLAAVTDGTDFPHPKDQSERLVSPAAYVGDPSLLSFTRRIVQFDANQYMPRFTGVAYRIALSYYPWTCPSTGTVGWTIEPVDLDDEYFYQSTPTCGSIQHDLSEALPPDGIDSLRVVFQLKSNCEDDFTGSCLGNPQQTNQTPYFDNIRLALVSGDAPIPTVDLLYQDAFPRSNTLLPNATADAHSFLNTRALDQDPTNAQLGDSAVLRVGSEPMSEAYLNFRVFPGPSTNWGDPWFSSYGGDFLASAASGPQDNWARARMDTAETSGGAVNGRFATYDWPNGSETGAKIIPDDVLTPGVTVEYFFTTNFTLTPATQLCVPDTTGGTHFEFEVLPGYFEQAGDILASCFLYVDAFNGGAQAPIEEWALSNLLGFNTDDTALSHPNWDRYDYLAADDPRSAPLARESSGDNGMTAYQSFAYHTVMYNTGTLTQEGLRDGDAALLSNFLSSDDFDRQAINKGLWLSGDGIASIMSRPSVLLANALLRDVCGAELVCATYRDPGCGGAGGAGDSTFCVRLDAASGADFPQSAAYALRGNGCPSLFAFDLLSATGAGNGNLDYVDQDAGEATTQHASVSNDQFAPVNPDNWRTVIDGFSPHHLRAVPGGFVGENCGVDSTAISTRTADVFGFLNVVPFGCAPNIVPAVPPDGTPSVTRLFPNAPNPFNPTTAIRYELASRAYVTLDVYDVMGRRVRTLADETQDAGRYRLTWDGTSDARLPAATGVYWIRLRTSLGFDAKTKMVLLK